MIADYKTDFDLAKWFDGPSEPMTAEEERLADEEQETLEREGRQHYADYGHIVEMTYDEAMKLVEFLEFLSESIYDKPLISKEFLIEEGSVGRHLKMTWDYDCFVCEPNFNSNQAEQYYYDEAELRVLKTILYEKQFRFTEVELRFMRHGINVITKHVKED